MRTSKSIVTHESLLQSIAVVALFLLSAQNAFSYLDPVSTTFLLQAIAGLFAAAVAGVRSFRRRVFGFFKTGKFVDPEEAALSRDGDSAIGTGILSKDQRADSK